VFFVVILLLMSSRAKTPMVHVIEMIHFNVLNLKE